MSLTAELKWRFKLIHSLGQSKIRIKVLHRCECRVECWKSKEMSKTFSLHDFLLLDHGFKKHKIQMGGIILKFFYRTLTGLEKYLLLGFSKIQAVPKEIIF